jgi:hypothetical protein
MLSFAIGLFFVYILGPEQKTIIMYPTPENYMKTQYKDNANNCFEIKPVEVQCPFNTLAIKTIPIQ